MFGIDDIGLVTSGGSLVQQVFTLGKYLKGIGGTDVISAHFDWEGQMISGDDTIKIERHPIPDEPHAWFFSVAEITDYTFIRAPVIEAGAFEIFGQKSDEENPDANYWRWVVRNEPGFIYGHQGSTPNLKVEFIVVGYKTKALIEHIKENN